MSTFNTTDNHYLFNPASGAYLSSGSGKNPDLKAELLPAAAPKQQWKFSGSGQKFTLQNVGKYLFYSGFDNSIYNVALGDRSEEWEITQLPANRGIKLKSLKFTEQVAYLRYDGKALSISPSDDDYSIWQVSTTPATHPALGPPPVSDTASLPTGEYRIRSVYSSKYLLTSPDGPNHVLPSATVAPVNDGRSFITFQLQDPQLKRQTWAVRRDDATNSYTIQNVLSVGSNPARFLAPNPGNDKTSVQEAAQHKWTIRPFNGGLCFRIDLDGSQSKSMGFSDYEAEEFDEVALVKSDRTPSQLWYFEKAEKPGVDQIHAQRSLTQGLYTIRSSLTSQFITTRPDDKEKLERIEKITKDTPGETSFDLKYISDSSPIFNLKIAGRYVVDGGDGFVKLQATVPANSLIGQWIVLPHRNPGKPGVYYICHPGAKHPVKAISARRSVTTGNIPDRPETTQYVLEDMVKGNTAHQWEFTTVTVAGGTSQTGTTQPGTS
ncbi:hypothetical protein AX17_004035 [Amanita inopinata Kibby_2008]|nr:hypothetical protein AX17_004035 [Amanita inopinata Kibby_2008]